MNNRRGCGLLACVRCETWSQIPTLAIDFMAQQCANCQAGKQRFALACRPDLAGEAQSTEKSEDVCPANAGSIQQARLSEESEGSLFEPSAESCAQLSPRRSAQDDRCSVFMLNSS